MWLSHITRVSLTTAFEEFILKGGAAGRDGITPSKFSEDLVVNISTLNRRLRGGSHRFSSYLLLLKSKGAKKQPREISVPVVRDRIALRAMAAVLREVEPSVAIELPQSKIARVIRALEETKYTHYVKLDVKDFYPNIDHGWLSDCLNRTLRRPELVELFMAAARTPTLSRAEKKATSLATRGVPQGLAISNGLAELAVRHVDQAMASRGDCVYFRYVDDILILANESYIGIAAAQVRHELGLAGLQVHDFDVIGKSSAGRILAGFEFLGYRFEWPRISVRAASIQRLEGTIARVFTRYKHAARRRNGDAWKQISREKLEWHINLIVSGCIFEGTRRGWLSYYSQIRHHQLLKHLDVVIRRQQQRHGLADMPVKSFVDSYRHAASRRVDHSGFVPNFDAYSVDEMREVLVRIFLFEKGEVDRLTDAEAARIFHKQIHGVTTELERDIVGSY